LQVRADGAYAALLAAAKALPSIRRHHPAIFPASRRVIAVGIGGPVLSHRIFRNRTDLPKAEAISADYCAGQTSREAMAWRMGNPPVPQVVAGR
jgi:hypothetical protein